MTSVIEQLLTIITTPPGNLVYHLVLAFSIVGALMSAINHYGSAERIQGRRMILGLSLILAVRLGLFLVAGLVWQAFNFSTDLLPNLDRAANTFCLILIIWLWAFPKPQRLADAATVLLGLLLIVVLAFTSLWWAVQPADATYNGSLVDIMWQSISLLLISTGIAFLLYRRPHSWEIGLGMLILLFLGNLAELLSPLGNSDYPGFARITQMAAYPMLLLLPQRDLAATASSAYFAQQPSRERRRYNLDPQIIDSFLVLSRETNSSEICKEICSALSHAMLADLCLLLTPQDAEGNMLVLCGYDLIREHPIDSAIVEKDSTPRLSSAILTQKPLWLSADSASTDLDVLLQSLGLSGSGALLAAPIILPSQEDPLGIVLLSLYSNRDWDENDQAYLLEIIIFITHILQQTNQVASLEQQLLETNQVLANLQSQHEAIQARTTPDRSQAHSLAALLTAYEEAQETISRLESDLETLRQTTFNVTLDGSVTPQEIDAIEGELRLTLEEVAHLRTALAESDQKIESLKRALAISSMSDEHEVAASIAQELRHPLSSVLGYSELLLSESIGILGAVQHKFLERIKSSTERMSKLVDDLASLNNTEESTLKVAIQPVDLSTVIVEAISVADKSMKEKDIRLKLDVPKQLPRLLADRDALEQILIHLLQNAISASSEGGQISLRVQVEKGEDQLNYVLFQVTDQGNGIPAEYLPRVFSNIYRSEKANIPGIGETGVALSIVKTLVEVHNGRIWVDSKHGIGSTFSVLLPVTTAVKNKSTVERGEQIG
jgi:signal transduction histidine kinase